MAPTTATSEPPATLSLDALLLTAGISVYTVSFFLPAVYGQTSIQGWLCAFTTLKLPLLITAGGLINPLFLLYLLMRTAGARLHWRCAIAIPALVLIPMSWVFIATSHFTIGVGHVLWVAGLLLILVPDLVRVGRGGLA